MNQVIRTFCEEKNIRFGQGYADGMEEFFAIDGNGIFLIYGRPIVGATQGEVVVRGDATRYLSELVARLDRNGNTVRVSGNTLSVVFKLRTPMGYGVPRRIPTPPTPSNNYLYFEAKQANSTVGMVSMLPTAPNLEYSTDGETFQEWQHTTGEGTHIFDTITLGAVGDKVYLRGTNTAMSAFSGDFKVSAFVTTGSIDAGGSVTSLLDNDGKTLTALADNGLTGLFMNNTALVTAPTFGNVTSIGDAGCYAMFSGCAALTNAMDMTTITSIGQIGCEEMYNGCTSLATCGDMGNVASFGTDSIKSMYKDCPMDSIIDADFDQQIIYGLKFEFPALPVIIGTSKTLSSDADVFRYVYAGQ